MSQAHGKSHYRELAAHLSVSTVRFTTPEQMKQDWDDSETILAATLNRTDLPAHERAYVEDVLQEVNRQREVAAHKVLRPWSKVVPVKVKP
jgi:hypothetical protein